MARHRNKNDKSVNFTPTEKKVGKYVRRGKISKQIAGLMGVTKHAIDKHRKNMLQKTNTVNSMELMGKYGKYFT